MRRIGEWIKRGDWTPGRHNLALLYVQLISLWLANGRGFDYGQERSEPARGLGAVESSAPLWVFGLIFSGSAAVVVLGLASRRAVPIIAGHVLLLCAYGGVGLGVLRTRGIDFDWLTFLALVVSFAGIAVALGPFATTVRCVVGVPLMYLGQYLLTDNLGLDYRTGVGLVGTGLIHLVLGYGTWVLWRRQVLTPIAERQAAEQDAAEQHRKEA